MKNVILILAILMFTCSYGQVYEAGGLYYSSSRVPYKSPPTSSIKNTINIRAENYRKNKQLCNELESILQEDLNQLKIESLNVSFRKELNEILDELEELKIEGEYADYTLVIQDLINKAEYAYEFLYEDEEEIMIQMMREQLQREKEENIKLKQELEKKEAILKF